MFGVKTLRNTLILLSFLAFNSLSSFAGNCDIINMGDSTGITAKNTCLSAEKEYQTVLERYQKDGTTKEVSIIIQSEQNWIKYRNMVCEVASHNVYDYSETLASCYQWLSEKRHRYYSSGFYLKELNLPKCIAYTDSIPNDGGGGGYSWDEVVSRKQCEERCKLIHDSAKKYDISGYCSFGTMSEWTRVS